MNIVFDIGGTNMRVAAVEGDDLKEIRKIRTPQDPQEGIDAFISVVRELLGAKKIDSIAGDIAGTIENDGRVSGARNLQRWKGFNIISALSKEFGVLTKVVNDCQCAGLGEAHKGAGKGAAILAYVTVSTGVGGARIVDGIIDYAASNFNLGRVPLDDSDLEDLISGTAVRKKFGIEPKELESIEERIKLADVFARGLVVLIREWTPDRIVIGGSMITGTNPIPLDRVRETLATLMQNPPEIKMAELGDNGGLYGGIVLATT